MEESLKNHIKLKILYRVHDLNRNNRIELKISYRVSGGHRQCRLSLPMTRTLKR
jgi:hypothetical protein